MKRDQSLDVLRGLMLVIMAIDHINGPLKRITYQPFGLFSAAEGFIFLSGLVFGLVYGKRLFTKGYSFVKTKAYHRAGVIYFYHMLVLVIILLFYFNNPYYGSLSDEIQLFFEKPLRSFMLYISFLFQPNDLDILPIYIILVFLGAFILKKFKEGKAVYIFVPSFLLYLFAQYQWYSGLFPGNNVEFIDTGNFNLLAWQLLFITGIYIGFLRAKGKLILPRNYYLLGVTGLIITIMFISRHSLFENNHFFNTLKLFGDRSNLGITRFINFLSFAYLVDFLKSKNIFVYSKFLAYLGRHSLQVFVFHLLIIYLSHPLILSLSENGDRIMLLAAQVVFSLSLIIPAITHNYFQNRVQFIKRWGI